MSDKKKSVRGVSTQSPSDAEKIRLKSPKEVAGGVSAVLSSMNHNARDVGLIRASKVLLKMNQERGFDCPGCAWPDPEDERSSFEFCENGAKAIAEEATKKSIGPEFFSKHSVEELSQKSDFWLGKRGRLTTPMYLPKGKSHYQAIDWEDAFQLISKKLRGLDSPEQAVFYTSGRTSNEAAFLYQLLVRMYGTNNFPDCSNMCHESSGVALYETVGSGKGTVTLEDFDHADAVFVIGQNPGTNHPRMLSALQKASRRGCRIISINPLKEAGNTGFSHPQEVRGVLGISTSIADIHVPVRINGDVALLKGIMKSVLETGMGTGTGIDRDFIEKHTLGFNEFAADLDKCEWRELVELSGIPQTSIEELARVFSSSRRVICCWAMGLTQHRNAVANIQSVVNLLLLGGHFGRQGAGACPVRGHSNVQGDRSMGITERPRTNFLKNLEKEFKFSPPTKHGLDTIAAIRAMGEGTAKVFFSMGGNFLSASPDTDYTAKSLQNCELTVQVSTKLNRSHLITGDEALILPCLGRTEVDRQGGVEQVVTVENSMGVVHESRGRLEPVSPELKSEVAIVAGVAGYLFPEQISMFRKMQENYSEIRDSISRVVTGFENMNQRLKEKRRFTLHHPVRDSLCFKTVSGKAHFTVHSAKGVTAPIGKYLLMTIRSHDQFNTTIYGPNDRYRGISGGRNVVLMNPSDIKERGWKASDVVNLRSVFNGEERKVERFLIAPYDIPSGCVAAYFPEANPLVPLDDFAEKSHTPSSKSVVVEIESSR